MPPKQRTITDEIADLRALDAPALVARYTDLFGVSPRTKNRENLWRRCAWKLQEQRFGGLSGAARKKLDALIGEIHIAEPIAPATGTSIVREWRGQTIEVRVVDNAFEWNGATYKSLTAVAFAVTGAKWNGRLFFNLTERKRKSS